MCRNLTCRAQQWPHNQFYNTSFKYKAVYPLLLIRASQALCLQMFLQTKQHHQLMKKLLIHMVGCF